MARFERIERPEMTLAQAHLHDALTYGPRAGVHGPFVAWMHSPTVGAHLDEVGTYLRHNTPLPARLVELVILQTAAFWRSSHAWQHHATIAQGLGIDDGLLNALRLGRTPWLSDPIEQHTHALVAALLSRRAVSEQIWVALAGTLGPRGMADLVALVGYYGMVATTLSAMGANVEIPGLFPALDR